MRGLGAMSFALLSLAPGLARAQNSSEPKNTPPAEKPGASEPAAGNDAPLPQDYEEKDQTPPSEPDQARSWEEPPGTEPEDAYLLVPRIVLFPVNLALKIVALPLRGTAVLIDRHHVVEHVEDILYNDERTAGVLPSLSYQSGYGFSAGARAFHDDLLGNDEELRASAQYGGLYLQGYKLTFAGDRVAHTPLWLEAHARYEAKPALWFSGFGNQDLDDAGTDLAPREAAVGSRYRENRGLLALTLGSTVGPEGGLVKTGVEALYNVRAFGGERRNFPEPSIEEVYDTAQIPGFEDGTRVFELDPTFIYDSRDTRGITSSGVYLDMFGGYAWPRGFEEGFWHYGVTMATFIDLYKRSRTLSFRGILEGVHGDDEDIPFTDLVRLGGPMRLRGYELDRFRDNLAAVGTLEYRYPVHELVSGELFLDAGRVGRNYREVFDRNGLEEFNLGGGLGFVFHDRDSVSFKIEAAYGDAFYLFISSDPLDQFRDKHKRL